MLVVPFTGFVGVAFAEEMMLHERQSTSRENKALLNMTGTTYDRKSGWSIIQFPVKGPVRFICDKNEVLCILRDNFEPSFFFATKSGLLISVLRLN
ncbi:MAG: hypothetical protein JW764_04240 [Chlorobiaceae bacterium]|nr:hypothetical protein [Chlorobiaceae bacterium]